MITTPDGIVTREPDGRDTLRFRREYPDPPALVWPALTESDRLARWFGSFTGDARPGGTVVLTMTSAEDSGGTPSSVRIVGCDPSPPPLGVDRGGRRGSVGDRRGAGGRPVRGTVLRFSQTLPPGFSPSDAGPGWHWYLDRLGASLSGEAFPDWEDYAPLAPGTPDPGTPDLPVLRCRPNGAAPTVATMTTRARGAGARVAVAAGVTVTAWASAFVAIRAVGPVFGAGPPAVGRRVAPSTRTEPEVSS